MPNLVLTQRLAGADSGVRWLMAPYFILRLAGLPMDSVIPLRSPRTVEWAEGTLDLETRLAAARTTVADALESVVGTLADDTLRRQVLDVRRDVFNLRLPRQSDAEADIIRGVGPVAGDLLADWLDMRRRLAARLAEGDRVLASDLAASRRHLRALADHPHLRYGLLLASPSLERHLPTYLGAGDGPLGKRARRIERSLLEYAYRTACKTSPFSTLTAVELGRMSGDPDGGFLDVADVGGAWRSYVRLSLAAVAPIVDLVVSSPTLRGDLPVRVTSGWRQDRERIRYVRRQHTLSGTDAAVAMGMVRESLFFLNAGEVLGQVLASLPEEAALRVGELVDRLHRAAPDRLPRADVDQYVEHLLRLGLLTVPTLHIDIHHPDPVGGLADRLLGLDRGWAAALAGRLRAVGVHVSDYRHADLAKRRRLLDRIRLELAEAQHELGREEPTVPRTLLYEDVTVGTTVTASTDQWAANLLPALRGLARILPVFDLVLPQRIITRGFFRARFGPGGRCGDVLRFVHEFGQDFYEQHVRASMSRKEFDDDGEYVPQPNWLKLPELDALDDARREVVRRIRRAYAELSDSRAELVLDDEFVDAVARRLPDLSEDLDPRSFFIQVGADAAGRPLAVLNRAYSGLTLLFSRFAHCFDGPAGASTVDDFADSLRATLAAAQPPGAVFAELTGGYETTNLNLHPVVTPYELVCPGDVSFRDRAEQIPVDELEIVDDEANGQLVLRSRRLGVRVIPVYLGFLLPMALPEVQRLLLNFACTAMAGIDLWSGTDRPLGDAPVGGHPRVRYRNLVLQRELWKTAPDRIPLRREGQSDAEWMLGWVRWRRELGLPRQVFVTVDASALREQANAADGQPPAMGTNKPQYVDFDSYFSLTLLENLVKNASRRVVFTEMLPDQDGLWVRQGSGRYVTELTIEIDGLRWRNT